MCNDIFELHTDASGKGVRAVLNVHRQNEELPVAFYSGAEVRYAATKLEALPVVEAVKMFLSIPLRERLRLSLITNR